MDGWMWCGGGCKELVESYTTVPDDRYESVSSTLVNAMQCFLLIGPIPWGPIAVPSVTR